MRLAGRGTPGRVQATATLGVPVSAGGWGPTGSRFKLTPHFLTLRPGASARASTALRGQSWRPYLWPTDGNRGDPQATQDRRDNDTHRGCDVLGFRQEGNRLAFPQDKGDRHEDGDLLVDSRALLGLRGAAAQPQLRGPGGPVNANRKATKRFTNYALGGCLFWGKKWSPPRGRFSKQ